LNDLKTAENFDLEKIVRERLPKRGKLNVLDSGAGFLGISAGLKAIFGNRVFVTAVNLMMPKLPYKSSSKTRALIRDSTISGNAKESFVSARYRQLAEAHKKPEWLMKSEFPR
jgi:hypothetical protein